MTQFHSSRISDPDHEFYSYWRDLVSHASKIKSGLDTEAWKILRTGQHPSMIVFSSPYVHMWSPPGTMFTVGGNPGAAVLYPNEPDAVAFKASNFYAADHIDSTEDILIVADPKADPTVERAILAKEGKLQLGEAEKLWAKRYIDPALEKVRQTGPELNGPALVYAVQKEVLRRSLGTLWTYPGVQGGKKNFLVHALIIGENGAEIMTSAKPGEMGEFQDVKKAAENSEDKFYKIVRDSVGITPRASKDAAANPMVIIIRCSDSRDDPNLAVPPGYDYVVIAANAGALSPKPAVPGSCSPSDVTLEQISATKRKVIVEELAHNLCGAVAAAVGAVTQPSHGHDHHHADDGHACVNQHIGPIVLEAGNLLAENAKLAQDPKKLAVIVEGNMARWALDRFMELPLMAKMKKQGQFITSLNTMFNFRDGLMVQMADNKFRPIAGRAKMDIQPRLSPK